MATLGMFAGVNAASIRFHAKMRRKRHVPEICDSSILAAALAQDARRTLSYRKFDRDPRALPARPADVKLPPTPQELLRPPIDRSSVPHGRTPP